MSHSGIVASQGTAVSYYIWMSQGTSGGSKVSACSSQLEGHKGTRHVLQYCTGLKHTLGVAGIMCIHKYVYKYLKGM